MSQQLLLYSFITQKYKYTNTEVNIIQNNRHYVKLCDFWFNFAGSEAAWLYLKCINDYVFV